MHFTFIIHIVLLSSNLILMQFSPDNNISDNTYKCLVLNYLRYIHSTLHEKSRVGKSCLSILLLI